jgi:hypothetical protein
MSNETPRPIVKGACYVNGVTYTGNVVEDKDAVGHVSGGNAYPDDQHAEGVDGNGVPFRVTTLRGLALDLTVVGASRDWLGRPCACLVYSGAGERVETPTGYVVSVDERTDRVGVRAVGPFSAPWLAPDELA